METFSRETLAPEYVTGFVEGTGTFTYSRSSKQISIYFAIKLAAADQPILEQLQQFFGGIGTIYETTNGTTRYLRVSRHNELPSIVQHFDEYPFRTSKRHLFSIWREMVNAKQQFRKPDREYLEKLAAQLSDYRVGDTQY